MRGLGLSCWKKSLQAAETKETALTMAVGFCGFVRKEYRHVRGADAVRIFPSMFFVHEHKTLYHVGQTN